MSTLKVNKIRDTSGSADAITLDPSGGAVLAGVTTISTARITTGITTSIQVGGGVTISESGIEASGIGITCANINGQAISGRRNLIHNGACLVNQRYATGQPVSGYGYGVDRLRGYNSGSARYDLTQAGITDLDGFSKAYKLEVTTAQSTYSGSTISVAIETALEGQDIAHLNFGTSNAKNITISFYVKSSVTGDFACAVFNGNSIDRVNAKDFTINSANTWERKVVTFVGDTGGTWRTDNTQGLYVALASAGSDSNSAVTTAGTWQGGGYKNRTTSSANIFATNGATMYFTGLQLEIGSQATAFEHHTFAEELALCQRYFETSYPSGYSAGHNFNDVYPFDTSKPVAQNYIASDDTTTAISYPLMVNKRANPTVTIYSAKDGTSGQAWTYKGTGGTNANDALNVIQTREQSMLLGCSLGAVNQASEKYFHYTASSEL